MLELNQTTTPTMHAIIEATGEHLNLERPQVDAYQKALEYMTQKDAHGAQKRVGRFIVGFAVEHMEWSEGQRPSQIAWEGRQDENVHVEITIQDRTDGHFIPGLFVYATLVDEAGNEVGTLKQPFLSHPWQFHYGRNWKIPGEGRYTLRVRIEAPQFMRYDQANGTRFTRPIEVEFTDVDIKTGSRS